MYGRYSSFLTLLFRTYYRIIIIILSHKPYIDNTLLLTNLNVSSFFHHQSRIHLIRSRGCR